jgi:hypothetical protein
VGVLNQEAALLSHLAASVQRGRSCLALPVAGGGTGTVCLLPCHRWNYCHDDQSCCTSPQRLPLGLTAREHLERAGTAVLHQARPQCAQLHPAVTGHCVHVGEVYKKMFCKSQGTR